MLQFGKDNMLLSIERTIYITLLGMGCYFIYLGDVIGKFQAKGTDFATDKEPITELPTINMWFWPNLEDFKYGRDFNISLQANGKPKGINLTHGDNTVPDAGLVMHFHDTYPPNNWLKITPTNFLPDMELDYLLTLTIENPRIMWPRPFQGRAQTQVGVTLNAENNSLNCHGGKFYDGDVKPLLSLPGNDNVMIISPQKSIYLEDIQPQQQHRYWGQHSSKYVIYSPIKAQKSKVNDPVKSFKRV